jgi:VWFA-related protein
VVALDANGKPVKDLKREEVSIRERGAAREVAVFRFEGRGFDGDIAVLPPGEFTNRVERLRGFRRNVTAIVLDTVNTAPAASVALVLQERNYQEQTRGQLLRYLTRLPENTRAALCLMEQDRVAVAQDFTDDVTQLRARLAEANLFERGAAIDRGFRTRASRSGSAEGAAGAAEANAAAERALSHYNAAVRGDRLLLSLAALEALANRMEPESGRKSILWMSVGMPVLTRTEGWPKSYAAAIERTARRLASQGVVVYGVPVGESKFNAAMDMLAETTGGRVVRNLNDPAEGLNLAAADDEGAYTVGFYSKGEPDDKWHGVDLKVNRPGVKLTYRQGYAAAAIRKQHEWTNDNWRSAIFNSIGSTSLRMDVRYEANAATENASLALKFELEDLQFQTVDGKPRADVEIGIAEIRRDDTYNLQRRRAGLRWTRENGGAVQWRHAWKPDSAAVRIRVVLRDLGTGRMGTVDIPLSTPGSVISPQNRR